MSYGARGRAEALRRKQNAIGINCFQLRYYAVCHNAGRVDCLIEIEDGSACQQRRDMLRRPENKLPPTRCVARYAKSDFI